MHSKKSGPKLKLVLLGDMGSGKSSLMTRHVDARFSHEIQSTLGTSCRSYRFRSSETEFEPTVLFELWDTAGQERYRALAPMYTRNAHGILICIDSTLPLLEQQQQCVYWMTIVREQWSRAGQLLPRPPVIALASTKSDLTGVANESKRIKLFSDLWADHVMLSSSHDAIMYTSTSAKTGAGVEECFSALMTRCIEVFCDGCRDTSEQSSLLTSSGSAASASESGGEWRDKFKWCVLL
jgi:Ras-related protein Rab-5C